MRILALAYSSNEACRSRWSGVRFSNTPISGRKLSIVSSWKLLISATVTVESVEFSTSASSGVPMLPPTITGMFAVFKMCATSEVVVVFPFDPVIATSFPRRNLQASSISLHTGILRARASTSAGRFAGTPGLSTIKSCCRKLSGACPPSSSFTPAARSLAAVSASSDSRRSSIAVTVAPYPALKSAVTIPVRPSPTTSTRFPARSIPGLNANHLNFKVVSENSANTSATIQNRTMIFDSLHPRSSK